MTDYSLGVEGAGLEIIKHRLDAHYKTFKKTSKPRKTTCTASFFVYFLIFDRGPG